MFNREGFFYHETLRSLVVTFGAMFSDLHIQRRDSSDAIIQDIRVPIAYSPKMAFLRRLQQDPDLNTKTQIDLPRLSFEVSGFAYDSQRRVNKLQTIMTTTGDAKQQRSPVPYNITMKLFLYSKNMEDNLIILEQILPHFGPEYTVTVNVVPSMNIKQDVPFLLSDVSTENTMDHEGFGKLAVLVTTLTFVAKIHLFGPVTPSGIIKTVNIDFGEQFGTYTAQVNPTAANKDDPHTITETFPAG